MFKPTTFGKFYLYEKLAIGGMAEIFKAKLYGIAGFEKTLVVKQILPEYAADNEFVKMFIDEANIAVSLTHGNIVPVYELGKIGERYYIAMEFVDGENLETIIDEGVKLRQEIPVAKAVEITIETLKGLDYAHRKQGGDGVSLGIVHRDVSPQNIMVSFDGEVKIVDFGIAKAASKLSLTRVGTLKGKFGYMSPEQAAGQEVDRRTDVYAAAIVLWEVLTGKRLYDADNDVELLRKVRAGLAPPPRQISSRVPEALDRIVSKALARDLTERYQEAGQFQLDLQRWLYSRPEEPGEETLANWMRRLFRRETHPRPTPVPPPAVVAPPPVEKLKADASGRARRDVSFARNSEILKVLEQAEEAARDLASGAEPTTTGSPEPSVSSTGETAETAPFSDETRSQSISADFDPSVLFTSPGAGDDQVLEWDENTDKTMTRRAAAAVAGEYVERSAQDGPIIRVPAVGRRPGGAQSSAPWQASATPRDDEETRPPTRTAEAPRRGMPAAPPPPPAGSGPTGMIGDITGDTRKPSRGSSEEVPLFPAEKKKSVVPILAGAAFLLLALVAGFAVVAIGFWNGGKTVASTPAPSPTITSFSNVTKTPAVATKTPAPVPSATATAEATAVATRVAIASERKASFDTIPSGANVYLGTKLLGRTPLTSVSVPSGEELVVRYSKQGYRELKETYAAGADALKASERLEAIAVNTPAPAMGKISVQSTPWGEVSIDGVKIKNTPLLSHSVKVGTRKVTVFCPSLKKTETRIVVVRANEELDPLLFNFE